MNTAVVSVIGLDCPGVVYAVSNTLSAQGCNIEEVSQTILKNQFAAIFIVSVPDELPHEALRASLVKAVQERGMLLTVAIRPFEKRASSVEESEPFVVTVDGEDRLEIIAGISRIFTQQGVNIDNLKALRPEDAPGTCLIVFEISLPLSLDRTALRQTLQARAAEMGLHLSIQHRDIFEAVHRVPPM